MPRVLKAIRLDRSDTHVFAKAAAPGEVVLPGSFAFQAYGGGDLSGKLRQAFVSGFLSLETFGWTTLATPADTGEAEIDALRERLAEHFVERYGAPDMDAARPVARAEIDDMIELAGGLAINTLLAVKREFDENGSIREQFHVVTPPAGEIHARVWDVSEDE
ncbi:hypothetical protein HPQ64_11760 [Rhizobiales bacterium]|uniref:DUF6505 family protein n=1 Tax=Hongsoonwoonella zoysiae TaxID=2821844 RepID=UPI001560A8D2|nr:DUF6505 family protein [Hongsoonwoonella zoysiae]NRG18366.1 hypothetical protein [Hongsoonwoonella zoysiae]